MKSDDDFKEFEIEYIMEIMWNALWKNILNCVCYKRNMGTFALLYIFMYVLV